ncbi:MAG: hypothetical protein ACFFEN_03170 [Candidatus Thorarchaeota archaeon]
MNKAQNEEFTKGFMNYLDVLFAFCHSTIIIFPLIFVRANLALEILGITISVSILILLVIFFIKSNPFYITYGVALLFGNFFFLIPSVILIPLISIFLIPEICYIVLLTWKGRLFSASRFYGDSQYRAKAGSYGLPPDPNPNLGLREGLQAEKVERRYKAKWHVILSFILLIVVVAVFIVWYNLSLI